MKHLNFPGARAWFNKWIDDILLVSIVLVLTAIEIVVLLYPEVHP